MERLAWEDEIDDLYQENASLKDALDATANERDELRAEVERLNGLVEMADEAGRLARQYAVVERARAKRLAAVARALVEVRAMATYRVGAPATQGLVRALIAADDALDALHDGDADD